MERGCLGEHATLRVPGDGGHDLDGAHRVLAHRGLFREHHGVASVQDRVRDVGDLGAGRLRRGHHRIEHLGRRDDGLGPPVRLGDELLLNDGNPGERRFEAEIAARDHDAVGGVGDRVEVVQRRLRLDLRDQGHPTAQRLDGHPGGAHVLDGADER